MRRGDDRALREIKGVEVVDQVLVIRGESRDGGIDNSEWDEKVKLYSIGQN